MKRSTILGKGFGLIALIAVIGFFATACPEKDGDDEDGGYSGNVGGPAFLGDKLELSGQVYEHKSNNGIYSYQAFSGNLTIYDNDNHGGSGEIKNGQLSYSIGVPANLKPLDFEDDYNWELEDGDYFYNNFSVSKANVKGVIIDKLSTDSNGYSNNVRKTNEAEAYNEQNGSYSYTYEEVYYVYVEEDVTVSGSGKTSTYSEPDDGVNYTVKYISGDLNLAFKKGWNAVYMKMEQAVTFTGTIDDPTTLNETNTVTTSLSNPSLRWVLW